MLPDAPSLDIVIVSYNVREELAACLRSVVGHTTPYETTVIVVDNGSQDGTLEMLEQEWPMVKAIDAGGNVGFARANNLGIRAGRADFVLLLNPDTVAPPGSLPNLVRALGSHPEAAAAGPRLVDAAGFPELSFGWPISPLGELRQKIVSSLYRRRIRRVVRYVDLWARTPGEREWLTGACLALRRADLEAVGLFDERYFMYTEDVDLCLALRQRGRALLFVPHVEVLHLRGVSAGRNPVTERLRRQSHLAFYRKHHPRWVGPLKTYLRLTGRPSAE